VKLTEKGLARRAETPLRPRVTVADAFELGYAPEAAAHLLEKYGLGARSETLVSGLSAEAFGLGRAVGAVRRGLDAENRDEMGRAFNLLRSSRHEAARQIAELIRQPPADAAGRLEELTQALRRAIGA